MEKAMAPHSSTLAWKIPWTEEPGVLQSMGSPRVGHDWSDLARTHAYVCEVGGNNIVSIRCAFWFFMLDVQANFWNAIHCLDGLLLLLLSHFSCVRLCATPQTAAHQALPSLGFSRQEHWEWVAISNAWKWKVKVKLLSCVRLLATPWTAAHQAPLSMGFSRQEYWSELPLPSPFVCESVSISQICSFELYFRFHM